MDATTGSGSVVSETADLGLRFTVDTLIGVFAGTPGIEISGIADPRGSTIAVEPARPTLNSTVDTLRRLTAHPRSPLTCNAPSTLGDGVVVGARPGVGRIVDADIEINAEHHKFAFTLQGEGQGTGVDLQSVITHEAGHFLGLAHSEHPQATMHASVAAGETNKRSLHEDDRTGLNALYGREASWRSALALEEKKDRSLTQEELGVSCSVAGRMGSAVPWSMALPAILGLLMMVKRRFRG